MPVLQFGLVWCFLIHWHFADTALTSSHSHITQSSLTQPLPSGASGKMQNISNQIKHTVDRFKNTFDRGTNYSEFTQAYIFSHWYQWCFTIALIILCNFLGNLQVVQHICNAICSLAIHLVVKHCNTASSSISLWLVIVVLFDCNSSFNEWQWRISPQFWQVLSTLL